MLPKHVHYSIRMGVNANALRQIIKSKQERRIFALVLTEIKHIIGLILQKNVSNYHLFCETVEIITIYDITDITNVLELLYARKS